MPVRYHEPESSTRPSSTVTEAMASSMKPKLTPFDLPKNTEGISYAAISKGIFIRGLTHALQRQDEVSLPASNCGTNK